MSSLAHLARGALRIVNMLLKMINHYSDNMPLVNLAGIKMAAVLN